jgi:hypothetical protein
MCVRWLECVCMCVRWLECVCMCVRMFTLVLRQRCICVFFFFCTFMVCWHSAVPFLCIRSECWTPERKIGPSTTDMSTALWIIVMEFLTVLFSLLYEKFSIVVTYMCECEYNNQLDALFISSLLSYNTATCSGLSTAHHQEVECIYVANGTCYSSMLTVSGPGGPLTVNLLRFRFTLGSVAYMGGKNVISGSDCTVIIYV